MNPLIDRIWDVWTNTAQEELLAMIAEFRVDYILDDTFNHALDIVEEAILEENYDRAKVIFTEMSPAVFTRLDFELFVELLDEAVYGY